jgi:uncharacterized protein
VHPEAYPVVEKMAHSLEVSVSELMQKKDLRNQLKPSDYVTETIGLPTINDILAELEKPGRDPRESFNPLIFTEGFKDISELTIGQQLTGVVNNVAAFGAFIDVGLHCNGLVHISELSKTKFVKNATDEVSVGQNVIVWVKSIDVAQNRLALTMKGPLTAEDHAEARATQAENQGSRPKSNPGAKSNSHNPKANKKNEPPKGGPPTNNPFASLKKLLS